MRGDVVNSQKMRNLKEHLCATLSEVEFAEESCTVSVLFGHTQGLHQGSV